MILHRIWIGIFILLVQVGLCATAFGAGVRVTFDSSPPGAAVYIDGKESGVRGYSSPTFKIRLTRGQHRLLLELAGYKPFEQMIDVRRAQTFAFTLERAQVKVEIKPPGTDDTARGGEIFVDGTAAGTVPAQLEMSPGRHLIEVRKPDYHIFSETLEVTGTETRSLMVVLKAEVKAGSLMVSASGDGEVFVDGKSRGPAPTLVDNLPEGEHQVEVRRPDPAAPPWRQSVRVVAGQRASVVAEAAPVVPKTGSLLVVTAAPEAEVVIDGTTRIKANQPVGELTPGQHLINVQAKGYKPFTKIVEVEVGKRRVENVELQQSAEGRGVGTLRVVMVNPVEGAQYYINGKRYDEATILSEKGVEAASGQNIIVVRKEGFGEVRKEINLPAGGTASVPLEMRNTGKIFISSTPSGARISIDGVTIGQTPFLADNVPAGPHAVELMLPGYPPQVQQVVVGGGERATVSAELGQQQNPTIAGPPDRAAVQLQQFGASSFSALTNTPARFTLDIGTGFPYFVDLRLTIGAASRGMFGLDGGIELRTTFYETDINAILRAQLFRVGIVAGGLNLLIGGGGGPRKRDGFVFEAGLPITLLAGRKVHLTLRPYLQVYSDRLCPGVDTLRGLASSGQNAALMELAQPEHAGDRCAGGGDENMPNGYPNAILDGAGSAYQPQSPAYQVLGTPVLDRFAGARFLLQGVLEVEVTRSVNLWLLIEGAPGQEERQSYTDKFNRIFPIHDTPLYGRGGVTLKF